MKSGIVALIVIVCIIGSAGATYLASDMMTQSRIDDRDEYDRLMVKALDKMNNGFLNKGFGGAHNNEAGYN